MSKYSINNRFIVESYKSDRSLTSDANSKNTGFAFVSQKVTVKGMKLLVSAFHTMNGESSFIPAGSTIYIKEELLHTQAWAKKVLSAEGIDGEFIIVDVANVEFVDSSTAEKNA